MKNDQTSIRDESQTNILKAGVKAYHEYLATCSQKEPGFMLNAMQAARVAMEDEFQSHPYLFSLAPSLERCTLDIGGEPRHYTLDEEVAQVRADEEEATALCETLSGLLRGVALAVRGPEEPLKRHGFADLPLRVKTVIDELAMLKTENETLRKFANEMLGVAFEGGSLDGADVQDIGVLCGMLTVREVEERCGEVCACAEYGFPIECYRKTSVTHSRDASASLNEQNLTRQEE